MPSHQQQIRQMVQGLQTPQTSMSYIWHSYICGTKQVLRKILFV